MLLIYLIAISIALFVCASSNVATSGNVLLLVSGFPAFFCWAFVSSRLLKIIRDTDKWLIPAMMKGVVAAVLLQALITIIIPTALLAFVGYDFFFGIICLTAVAACGLLFMLLPRTFGVSMSLLPTLFTKLVSYEILPAIETNEFFAVITITTTIMLGISFWRFHRLRSFEGDITAWNTPMALMPDAANGWGLKSETDSNSKHLLTGGIRFEPALLTTTPLNSPKLAMRSILGAPFMPLTARSQIKKWLLLGGAYLILPSYMAYSMSGNSGGSISLSAVMGAYWISLLGLGISLSAALMRLNTLYARDNAELAELALLPGWHNGRNARQLFTQVMSMHVARALLIPLAFALLVLSFIETKNHDAFLIILSLYTTCLLIAAGYFMNIISGNKPRALLLFLLFIAMFLISLVQLIFSVDSKDFDNVLLTTPLWIAFPTLAIFYCFLAWSPFKDCVHPFLRN